MTSAADVPAKWGDDTLPILAAQLISVFDEGSTDGALTAQLREISVARGLYPILALQGLPPLSLGLPDDEFVERVRKALTLFPAPSLRLSPDGQHIQRLTRGQQIAAHVDNLVSRQGGLGDAECALALACFMHSGAAAGSAASSSHRGAGAAAAASGAPSASIADLHRVSQTLRCLARTPQEVTEALYHYRPVYVGMSRDGKRVSLLTVAQAIERVLDAYFAEGRLTFDAFLMSVLAENGGCVPLPLLVSSHFPRLHRILRRAYAMGVRGSAAAAATSGSAEHSAVTAAAAVPPTWTAVAIAADDSTDDDLDEDGDDADDGPTAASAPTAAAAAAAPASAAAATGVRRAASSGGGNSFVTHACALVAAVLRRHVCDAVRLADDGISATPTDLGWKLKRQIEFYFGDDNFAKDAYLRQLAADDPDGFVSLTVICSFKKMQSMRASVPVAASALVGSSIVELSPDGMWVRRCAAPLAGGGATGGSRSSPAAAAAASRWETDGDPLPPSSRPSDATTGAAPSPAAAAAPYAITQPFAAVLDQHVFDLRATMASLSHSRAAAAAASSSVGMTGFSRAASTAASGTSSGTSGGTITIAGGAGLGSSMPTSLGFARSDSDPREASHDDSAATAASSTGAAAGGASGVGGSAAASSGRPSAGHRLLPSVLMSNRKGASPAPVQSPHTHSLAAAVGAPAWSPPGATGGASASSSAASSAPRASPSASSRPPVSSAAAGGGRTKPSPAAGGTAMPSPSAASAAASPAAATPPLPPPSPAVAARVVAVDAAIASPRSPASLGVLLEEVLANHHLQVDPLLVASLLEDDDERLAVKETMLLMPPVTSSSSSASVPSSCPTPVTALDPASSPSSLASPPSSSSAAARPSSPSAGAFAAPSPVTIVHSAGLSPYDLACRPMISLAALAAHIRCISSDSFARELLRVVGLAFTASGGTKDGGDPADAPSDVPLVHALLAGALAGSTTVGAVRLTRPTAAAVDASASADWFIIKCDGALPAMRQMIAATAAPLPRGVGVAGGSGTAAAAAGSFTSGGGARPRPRFSAMTFNVLADCLTTAEVYDYTHVLGRRWDERRDRIMREVVARMPTVLCLQEVQGTSVGLGSADDPDNHAAWFHRELAALGYDGCFRVNVHDPRLRMNNNRWPRIGVSLYWLTSEWAPAYPTAVERVSYSSHLVDACGTNKRARAELCLWQGGVTAALRHLPSGSVAVFAGTHISCRWQQPYIQIMQAHALVREIERLVGPALLNNVPVVVMGDWNIKPDSGLFRLMTRGYLPPEHPDLALASHPPPPTTPIALPFPAPRHTLQLRSTYTAALGAELEFTNYASRSFGIFKGTLDYIFYSPGTLQPTAVLGGISEATASEETALPSRRFPSDHIPLYAEYTVQDAAWTAAACSGLWPGESAAALATAGGAAAAGASGSAAVGAF